MSDSDSDTDTALVQVTSERQQNVACVCVTRTLPSRCSVALCGAVWRGAHLLSHNPHGELSESCRVIGNWSHYWDSCQQAPVTKNSVSSLRGRPGQLIRHRHCCYSLWFINASAGARVWSIQCLWAHTQHLTADTSTCAVVTWVDRHYQLVPSPQYLCPTHTHALTAGQVNWPRTARPLAFMHWSTSTAPWPDPPRYITDFLNETQWPLCPKSLLHCHASSYHATSGHMTHAQKVRSLQWIVSVRCRVSQRGSMLQCRVVCPAASVRCRRRANLGRCRRIYIKSSASDGALSLALCLFMHRQFGRSDRWCLATVDRSTPPRHPAVTHRS